MAHEYRQVLITGASSGLGRAMTQWFARRGATVFAAARRVEQLRALRDELAATGGHVEAVEMDVSKTHDTVDRIQAIDRECGGLDLVLANAGIGDEMSASKLSWERVERVLQTNVMGAAATLVAVLPAMLDRGHGHLAGVSSIAAFRGLPRVAAYSGSKAFLSTFLESLRVEVKRKGVRVTAIQPGFIKSELTAKNAFKMPFILETEDAAERIGKALLRGASEFTFPAPMAAVAMPLKWMPNGLLDLAMGRRSR